LYLLLSFSAVPPTRSNAAFLRIRRSATSQNTFLRVKNAPPLIFGDAEYAGIRSWEDCDNKLDPALNGTEYPPRPKPTSRSVVVPWGLWPRREIGRAEQ